MKTQKSFKWLFDRLIPNKKITVCDFDRESLIQIAESLNQTNIKAFQDNTIFAKMMVYCLINELEFYKDLEFAEKKLHEVLEKPLEFHYEQYRKTLNRLEMNKFRKSIGLSEEHCLKINETETKKEDEIIKENQQSISKYLKGIWSEDSVLKSLNSAITNLIATYKNVN